jgi:hypothetical protein
MRVLVVIPAYNEAATSLMWRCAPAGTLIA